MATIKEWLKKLAAAIQEPEKADVDDPTPAELFVPPTAGSARARTVQAHTAADTERHKVAGVSYHVGALLPLGTSNPDFGLTKKQMVAEGLTDERVYRTDFGLYPGELIPEPDNPADPKAIKVMARGVHIGYIKKGSCAHIHKLLREDRIEAVSCDIGGGAYKIVTTDCNEDGDEVYTLEADTVPYYAVVVIKLKRQEAAT